MADEVLLFLTYKPNVEALAELNDHFRSRPRPLDLDAVAGTLQKHLKLSWKPLLRGVPTVDFTLRLEGWPETPPMTTEDTIVYALDTVKAESREANELYDLVTKPRADLPVREVRVAVDLPTSGAKVWCPEEATVPLFGDITLALAQMRAAAAAAKGAFGQHVNVVIIDQGINRNVLVTRVPGARFVGGWDTPEFGKGGPPSPTGVSTVIPAGGWRDDGLGPTVTHATKMASLVLAVAPQARILDLALLPSHILSLRDPNSTTIGFLSWAAAAYLMLITRIPWIQAHVPGFGGPWVLSNSWAVYDLSTDFPVGSFLNYGSNRFHPLNLVVAALPSLGIADVVFAAGNCGQFCPDPRCGAGQVGLARSIYGVAALKDVLTVSAVRGDEIWLGYSSQGPADLTFGSVKPDVCAPSQFGIVGDWNRSFTGTSSACALTAGAVAARRSLVSTATEAPSVLRQRAVNTARRVANQTAADERRGAGMIDISAFV